jgi:hypothetical protein
VQVKISLFENGVLREIFGSKRDEVRGNGENHIMRSLMICIAHPILVGCSNGENEMGGVCSTYGGEERRVQGFGGET